MWNLTVSDGAVPVVGHRGGPAVPGVTECPVAAGAAHGVCVSLHPVVDSAAI